MYFINLTKNDSDCHDDEYMKIKFQLDDNLL